MEYFVAQESQTIFIYPSFTLAGTRKSGRCSTAPGLGLETASDYICLDLRAQALARRFAWCFADLRS
jgi:hypothetical protein